MALEQAGAQAEGSTVYVSLEPCNHQGRTGPCSEALIRAKVKEVFYATADPNPMASGGADRLRKAGIPTKPLQRNYHLIEQNRQFLYSQHLKRPFVTLKAAITLDGKIALPNGESKWITSEESRKDAHALRAERGVVLVGRKTAELDRAQLTVRHINVNSQPLRVVIDPNRVLAEDLPIFNSDAETLRFTNSPRGTEDLLFTDLPNLLGELFARGNRGVLVEGGRETTSEFVKLGLVDEIVLYIAPVLLGEGPSWVSQLGISSLAEAPNFVLADTQAISGETDQQNLRITLYSRNLSNFLASE